MTTAPPSGEWATRGVDGAWPNQVECMVFDNRGEMLDALGHDPAYNDDGACTYASVDRALARLQALGWARVDKRGHIWVPYEIPDEIWYDETDWTAD